MAHTFAVLIDVIILVLNNRLRDKPVKDGGKKGG